MLRTHSLLKLPPDPPRACESFRPGAALAVAGSSLVLHANLLLLRGRCHLVPNDASCLRAIYFSWKHAAGGSTLQLRFSNLVQAICSLLPLGLGKFPRAAAAAAAFPNFPLESRDHPPYGGDAQTHALELARRCPLGS